MSPESKSNGSDAVRDPLLGTTVAGRYKLIDVLGRGGMGKVYLGEHIAIRKRVAIKVLHQAYCERPALVKRFLIEARAATSIAHENVIEITDYGETDSGAAFFVMELLEGEELGKLLRRDRVLPWSRVSRILYQICRALEAAHSNGIVHRDMKPANCFLVHRSGIDDFVKLLDFGIAKIIEGEDPDSIGSLTEAGAVIGTPEFMSPEQIQGAPVDKRMDIYAVGCIAYRMLTGHLPFRDTTSYGTMTLQVHADPVPLGDRAPEANIPEPVQAMVMRALEKNPDARFQSMSEMLGAIEHICSVGATLNAEASQMLKVPTATAMPEVDLGRTEPEEGSSSGSAHPTPVPLGHDAFEEAMTSQLDAMNPSDEPISVPGAFNPRKFGMIAGLVGIAGALVLLIMMMSGPTEVAPSEATTGPQEVIVLGGTSTSDSDSDSDTTDSDSDSDTGTDTDTDSETTDAEVEEPEPEPTKKRRNKRVNKRRNSDDNDSSSIVLSKLDFMERSRGVRSVKSRTDACSSSGSGTVKVEVVVTGKTGRVAKATPSPNNALGKCLVRAIKRARFSRFTKSSQSFTHTFKF